MPTLMLYARNPSHPTQRRPHATPDSVDLPDSRLTAGMARISARELRLARAKRCFTRLCRRPTKRSSRHCATAALTHRRCCASQLRQFRGSPARVCQRYSARL
jgi:hypothetical protein